LFSASQILAGADGAGERQMAVDHHGLERRNHILEQFLAALLAVISDDRAQPLVIGIVERNLAGPFLAFEELLVVLRELRSLHQVGVVGRHIVVGVDAVPAPVRIARLRDQALRLRRVELQQHIVGQAIDRGGDREIPAALARAVLDRDA
jgi:hypothetical protein